MRVLVACEFSGIVRDAFIAKGHNAVSCDLLPSERPGPHQQCDVLTILNEGWDLLIGHPDCTYLTNTAVCWLWNTPEKPREGILYGPKRWEALDQAAKFFKQLLAASIPKIAIENPIPHCYAKNRIGATYTQLIQPYQFGHAERKATCLWLKNLPKLTPTNTVSLPIDKAKAQRGHYLSPSPTRWMERARTYQGIASAMAEQWGQS